jgi:DNA-binding IclR family transcriptional regulator
MASHAARTAYSGTQAVVRAVRLLKAFTAEQPERGLSELSRALGLNKTTAYRMLSALESEGMIERTPSGERYRLGPEMRALGSSAAATAGLREAARPVLEALAAETRETATLEVLVGRDVLIADEVMGTHVIGVRPAVGTRWPAHATSTGKAILAHDDAARGAFARTRLPAITPRTIADPEHFARELLRIRKRGFAVATEELEAGFVAVGVPVRDASGQVVAAISVGGPKSRLTPEAVAAVGRRLPAAAARIEARLGYQPLSQKAVR